MQWITFSSPTCNPTHERPESKASAFAKAGCAVCSHLSLLPFQKADGETQHKMSWNPPRWSERLLMGMLMSCGPRLDAREICTLLETQETPETTHAFRKSCETWNSLVATWMCLLSQGFNFIMKFGSCNYGREAAEVLLSIVPRSFRDAPGWDLPKKRQTSFEKAY